MQSSAGAERKGSILELVGIVGKANVGKSTLFSAMTLIPVEIANFPFTTVKANRGVTHLRVPCVCRELGVDDNPKNSLCFRGVRLVPVQIIDCPGLIAGAHEGRGLGFQFLDEIRQADALIVVSDAAGATDPDGSPVSPGSFDPVEDVTMVEREYSHWMAGIVAKDWQKISKSVETGRSDLIQELEGRLSGLKIKTAEIEKACGELGLSTEKPSLWKEDDLLMFAQKLRRIAKPFVIAANKVDIPEAQNNVERLRKLEYPVVPCSAEAERILRLAASKELIDYVPGDSGFTLKKDVSLSAEQRKALEMIDEKILVKWGSTGVQQLVNNAYLDVLRYIPVFPVEDAERLTDHDGNVLPDVYLMPPGSTSRDLAFKIHSDLGKGFLYAVDARRKIRLSDDYELKWGDIISIVSTGRRG